MGQKTISFGRKKIRTKQFWTKNFSTNNFRTKHFRTEGRVEKIGQKIFGQKNVDDFFRRFFFDEIFSADKFRVRGALG